MVTVILNTEDGQQRFEDGHVSMDPESREIVVCDATNGVLATFGYDEVIDIKIDLVDA